VDPNYGISYVSGLLTVTRASLSISANNESMVKGSPVPPLSASYSGFVNGDSPANLTTPVSLTTSAKSTSPQGTYPIVAKAAKSPDYAITFVNGVMTVTKAGGTNGVTPSDASGSLALHKKSSPVGVAVTNSQAVAISNRVEIEHLTMSPRGPAQFFLTGQPNQAYVLEMSTDLIHWRVLATGALPAGRFEFEDASATGADSRFYRVSTGR
jgi:hypothetical protein